MTKCRYCGKTLNVTVFLVNGWVYCDQTCYSAFRAQGRINPHSADWIKKVIDGAGMATIYWHMQDEHDCKRVKYR